MNKIKTKKAVYNDDFTECLEIGWYDFNIIEPFLTTCKKVPDKLPENITSLRKAFRDNKNKIITGYENWDTSKVINMNFMFYDCNNIKTLDISSFDTSNVVDMYGMFCGCWYLKTLDISSFDTKNLIDIRSMFHDCRNIITIDMFKNNNNFETRFMFSGCDKLEYVYFEGRTKRWNLTK